VLDLATTKDEQLAINLVSDLTSNARQIRSPLENLTNVQIAGKFERIVLTARGRVSVAGTGAAPRRNRHPGRRACAPGRVQP
jgi:tricorn protease